MLECSKVSGKAPGYCMKLHFLDNTNYARAKPPNWNWSGQILINY